MTNGTNPADNFFNASISTRTAATFHQKRPDYLNQFGFDADVFDATGRLANGQTRDDDPARYERRRVRAAGDQLRHRPLRPEPQRRQGGRPRHRVGPATC